MEVGVGAGVVAGASADADAGVDVDAGVACGSRWHSALSAQGVIKKEARRSPAVRR
jgi:hypothetical protein